VTARMVQEKNVRIDRAESILQEIRTAARQTRSEESKT